MQIRNCEVEVMQGDITELKVEAIVNAANNKLMMGGGVAGAIKKKGGEVIEAEAVSKGPIEIGGAVYTQAGNLPSRFVIHAATMGMDFATDEKKIRQACAGSLDVAEGLKIKSVAFPALGCGVGGFSYLACAKIMSQEIFKHLRETPDSSLREITFCLYNKEAYKVFNETLFRYLEHMIHKVQQGPFVTVDAIIEIDDGIVLIERSNPPFGWALPGGFVDYGENLEDSVRREAREETNLDLEDLRQFHTYSKPRRDPRFHTVSTVYISRGKGRPQSGSDAANLKIVKISELKDYDFAFDHKQIIKDYLRYKQDQDQNLRS
jgi:O-acetyl-ADP-ribose deacetylase (regulator of RNase III)/ADP-ribose pyrophosphatase YjhB (NUDIX family)